MPRDRLRVLTWQVHGNYLWYLSQVPHQFLLVTKPGHPPCYAGRTPSFPWGANVIEVPFDRVREAEADCVLYQSRRQWEEDRHDVLSQKQRRLPAIYLEHDPPQQHPTNTPHFAQDAQLLVHVTPFNALMWDSGGVPTRVIDHGVTIASDARYGGVRNEGIVVVNHLAKRGRRLGADVYLKMRERVPLRLAGMDSLRTPGGIGEVPNLELPRLMADFRFFFHPVRWTSLGLAVVEAMMVGLPIVGLATTELATIVQNGVNGWVDTDLGTLAEVAEYLLRNPENARHWGEAARRAALRRFNIERFVRDWDAALAAATARPSPQSPPISAPVTANHLSSEPERMKTIGATQ